ncbi:MAG TPA: phage holin family protein [Thermomicrobiales bacterium]|jgi:putative membrane protein|nr:phage holin family protein [Thermomicrobiales bacterium]
MLVRIIAYSIGSIVAILAVGTIFTSDLVDYVDERSVFIFGIVLGLMTALLKPILSALTLPISCLTFGLFALVLNAAMFGAAAWLTPDVEVTALGALVGGIFVAVINGVLYSVVDQS